MSPLEWGSRDAWLEEALRRVRDVCGSAGREASADALGELEALLRLPGDEPGWLRAAADSTGVERGGSPLPAVAESPRGPVPGGVPAVRPRRWSRGAPSAFRASRSALGQAFDGVETGMAIFGNGGRREVTRNACLEELLGEEPARESGCWSTSGARQDARGRVGRGRAGGLPGAGAERRVLPAVASGASAGTLLHEAAVIVLVDRLRPGLPTTQELRIAFRASSGARAPGRPTGSGRTLQRRYRRAATAERTHGPALPLVRPGPARPPHAHGAGPAPPGRWRPPGAGESQVIPGEHLAEPEEGDR